MNKKRISLLLLALPIYFFSCNSETASVDPSAIQKTVDSIASVKIEEAQASSIAECEARMTTEVKAKVDSIMASAKSK